jgi:cystathionine beta-lyase/cystathionine gamma-synthase
MNRYLLTKFSVMKKRTGKLTTSVHEGSSGDPRYGGLVNPIYQSSAYDYEQLVRYPRYFNTPNQEAVVSKMAALENTEDGVVFSSGMAAIVTSLLAVLKTGDHIVFQNDLYGGTHHAAFGLLGRFGIEHTMVDAADPSNFERAINKKTKAIYIETPSNPLLKITDVGAVGKIAARHGLVTLIDNTFSSPVNQNPADLGIDIILHSGTKYIGGHSDICCGVMVGAKKITEQIRSAAAIFGGSLDANTCYLVERSLKTIVLRVRQQNETALSIAGFLESEAKVAKVNYPGLKKHPGHHMAKKQMTGGFGGMLSFEVKADPEKFIKKLKLIRRAVSLGGVESTICSPCKTSHVKLTAQERGKLGISDKLLRLSVGIEESSDLIDDIKQAL